MALHKIHACANIEARCKTRRQPARHINKSKMHMTLNVIHFMMHSMTAYEGVAHIHSNCCQACCKPLQNGLVLRALCWPATSCGAHRVTPTGC